MANQNAVFPSSTTPNHQKSQQQQQTGGGNRQKQQQKMQQNGSGSEPRSLASGRRKSSSSGMPGGDSGHQDMAANGGGKFLPGPTSFLDFLLGILSQVARRYLFTNASKKAAIYLLAVATLSLIAEFLPLPRDWYIVQKHNVFNRFGTKIGWFWTCLLLCPFMWLTSLLHHESRLKAAYDQLRLLIGTLAWYIWTNAFVKFEHQTGQCHGSLGSTRNNCFSDGGKWIPGFDISGHSFLLLYSILLITEEATSFRNWPVKPRISSQHIPTRRDFDRFQERTKFIQWNFVLLFGLHLLWDFQLCVTALYYHNFWQKIIGATIAVCCWAVTYRFWYIVGFPFLPIRRHIKSF